MDAASPGQSCSSRKEKSRKEKSRKERAGKAKMGPRASSRAALVQLQGGKRPGARLRVPGEEQQGEVL